jgi:septal ring factor EnvC (AmiA/AmiB activator)
MKIESHDLIAGLSVLAALVSMLIVSRNARRATAVQTQNVDLARIRDLRQELRETKDELDHVKAQIGRLSRQLDEASTAATEAYRERAEMLRYARMPGMDLESWIRRFDGQSPGLTGGE